MKKFLCLVISILLLLSFCGCKNDKKDTESVTTNTDSVETIIETETIIVNTSKFDSSSEEKTSSEDDVAVSSNKTSSADKTSSTNKTSGQDKTSSVDKTSSNDKTSSANKTSSQDKTSTPDTSTPKEEPQEESILYLNDAEVLKKIKLNGRCEKASNGISLGLAASAIEFNTDSTAVMLVADCAADIYYSVVVDGQVVQKREVTTSGTNYIFVRALSKGAHNIKIIRDCEGRTDMYFTAVSLQLDDGELLEKDSDKKVIEFLGDSLTSGFGNLVVNGAANPEQLKNQSAMMAYPYLVASKLGFDYRIVSQSGIALAKRDGYVAFPDYYNLENYHLDREKKYTSSNPQDVDIVVINLGTNDIGGKLYDAKKSEDISLYKKYFADLVTGIGYRKDVKIVFITGVWYDEPITAIKEAVTELKSRGYNDVYTVQLNEYKSGGGSHPSSKEHEKIAETLVKFFKNNSIV